MDDLEGVDYSADMLAAEDIWRTPGRHTLAGDLLGFEPEVGFRVDAVRDLEGRGLDFGLDVDLEGCPGWSVVEGSRPLELQGSGSVLGVQEAEIPVSPARGVPGSGETGCPGVAATFLAGGLSAVEPGGHSSPAASSGKGHSPVRTEEVGSASVEKSASSRRKKNWIKKKQAGACYVFGLDVGWEEVLEMSKMTLVGKAMGRRFVIKTVIAWVVSNWQSHLGYAPEVVTLKGGWFGFNFKADDHAKWVLNRNWNICSAPFLLKPWHPLFDASCERVDLVPLWVRLPGLPLQYWKEFHLREIGNLVGTFLEADMSFLETQQRQVARILVNVNIRDGLAEDMKLIWGPFVIKQILDYENVPFRCRRCHAYGHPAVECKQAKKFGVQKSQPKVVIGDEVLENEEGLAAGPAENLSVPAYIPSEVDLAEVVPEFPLVEDHLAVAAVAGEGPSSSKLPVTGISSFALSPALNLFFHNVTIEGTEWVNALRNLKISLKPQCHQAPIELLSDVSLESPPKALSPDPKTPEVEKGLSSAESSDTGYFLRSCKKPAGGGLVTGSVQARAGRGRKSHMSKAMSRAKLDLDSGKQMSIERALRAVKARKRVIK